MESGDVVNYTATAAIILGMLKKPLLAAAIALPLYWYGRKTIRFAREKKRRTSEAISSGIALGSDATWKAANLAVRAKDMAVKNAPAARDAVLSTAAEYAPVVKQAAQQGFEVGSAAVAKAAPVMQKAVSQAYDVAAPIAGDAAAKALEGAKYGAGMAAKLAAENAPAVRQKAGAFLQGLGARLARDKESQPSDK